MQNPAFVFARERQRSKPEGFSAQVSAPAPPKLESNASAADPPKSLAKSTFFPRRYLHLAQKDL
ncbi:MAG: hypothetical protein MJ086_06810 [Lachnospiraceae bacterium]|nr:hypothetical protein [Lachnospiraceae bacterium]